jgi:hypothetical protein
MAIARLILIRTQNSTYEIQVSDNGSSRCRKSGPSASDVTDWKWVKSDDLTYLAKLCVGPSFDVPGVVLTSRVQDYQILYPSGEPKRTPEDVMAAHGIAGGMKLVTDYVVAQANGRQMMVAERVYKGYGPGCSETNHVGTCTCDLPPTCKVEGCTYSSQYGPTHDGSSYCKSGSIASGGTRAHCSCDYCY